MLQEILILRNKVLKVGEAEAATAGLLSGQEQQLWAASLPDCVTQAGLCHSLVLYIIIVLLDATD